MPRRSFCDTTWVSSLNNGKIRSRVVCGSPWICDHAKAWLKSEAAANEQDKEWQAAEAEHAIAQSRAILARLQTPSLTATEPLNLHDPAVIASVADHFFLTDLVRTETYAQIQHTLQARYQPDADGDWPDAYWGELQQTIDRLLQKAIELNQPVKAAA